MNQWMLLGALIMVIKRQQHAKKMSTDDIITEMHKLERSGMDNPHAHDIKADTRYEHLDKELRNRYKGG